jgi:hypothetical protein
VIDWIRGTNNIRELLGWSERDHVFRYGIRHKKKSRLVMYGLLAQPTNLFPCNNVKLLSRHKKVLEVKNSGINSFCFQEATLDGWTAPSSLLCYFLIASTSRWHKRKDGFRAIIV